MSVTQVEVGKHYTSSAPGWIGWDIEVVSTDRFGANVLYRKQGHKDVATYLFAKLYSSLTEVQPAKSIAFPGLSSHLVPPPPPPPKPSVAITDVEVGDWFVAEHNPTTKYKVVGIDRNLLVIKLQITENITKVFSLKFLFDSGYRHLKTVAQPVATYTRTCSCDGKTLLNQGCQCGASANCSCSAFDKLHFGCRCNGRGGLIAPPPPEKKPDPWRW